MDCFRERINCPRNASLIVSYYDRTDKIFIFQCEESKQNNNGEKEF